MAVNGDVLALITALGGGGGGGTDNYNSLSNKPQINNITLSGNKTSSDLSLNVTVEKQATAESGYTSTYVVKQGGTAVAQKINTIECTASNGIEITDNFIIQHTNSVTAQSTQTLDKVAFDAQGHITGVTEITTDRGIDITSNAIGHTNNIAASDNDITLDANSVTFKKLSYDAQGHINANASGKVLTFRNGIKSDADGHVEHSNSITAQTTQNVQAIKYDAYGHITAGAARPIVTAWSATTADTNIPSEKLVKTTMDTYLPLAGGTMTGAVFVKVGANNGINAATNADQLNLNGGTSYQNGAFMSLSGKSSSEAGSFNLAANNGTTIITLSGKADGTLTWNGNNVICANGGTMNGTIVSTIKEALARDNNTTSIHIYGGTGNATGASLQLMGGQTAGTPGTFFLKANDGTNSSILEGTTNGTLTWNNKPIGTLSTLTDTAGNTWIVIDYGAYANIIGSHTYASTATTAWGNIFYIQYPTENLITLGANIDSIISGSFASNRSTGALSGPVNIHTDKKTITASVLLTRGTAQSETTCLVSYNIWVKWA